MCVCVFDTAKGSKTHVLTMHAPMMAVSFAPWDPSLLVCAQRKEAVHVVRLLPEGRCVQAALECGLVRRKDTAYMEVEPWRARCLTRVITGMEIDADSRALFIAQPVR